MLDATGQDYRLSKVLLYIRFKLINLKRRKYKNSSSRYAGGEHGGHQILLGGNVNS
jgi:hypothetical protein